MVDFLSTTHKLTLQLKGKKCKKNSTSCGMKPTFILKKKEKTKKTKKEKEEQPTHDVAVQSRPMAGLDLAGH
jgi:hypothetical protein